VHKEVEWVMHTECDRLFHYGGSSLFGGVAENIPYLEGWCILRRWQTDFTKWTFKPKSANSILQGHPIDFVGCNLLVFVFLAFRICCVSFSSKCPPKFKKQTENTTCKKDGSTKRAMSTVNETSPQAFCTWKTILIAIFWKLRDHWMFSCLPIETDETRRNWQNTLGCRKPRACRIELADLPKWRWRLSGLRQRRGLCNSYSRSLWNKDSRGQGISV